MRHLRTPGWSFWRSRRSTSRRTRTIQPINYEDSQARDAYLSARRDPVSWWSCRSSATLSSPCTTHPHYLIHPHLQHPATILLSSSCRAGSEFGARRWQARGVLESLESKARARASLFYPVSAGLPREKSRLGRYGIVAASAGGGRVGPESSVALGDRTWRRNWVVCGQFHGSHPCLNRSTECSRARRAYPDAARPGIWPGPVPRNRRVGVEKGASERSRAYIRRERSTDLFSWQARHRGRFLVVESQPWRSAHLSS
ncbi:hypothetical protein DFH06DRAFT_114667 [Mycena polygramma]|nr:hypothetical protein DFH06DRAFT_114667 [Mycena polygramma]